MRVGLRSQLEKEHAVLLSLSFSYLFQLLIRLLSSFYQLYLLITVENINQVLVVSIYGIRLLE
jgi:hypothetical protein